MNTCCPNCGTEFDPETAPPPADPAQAIPAGAQPMGGSMLDAITREIGAMPRDQRKG